MFYRVSLILIYSTLIHTVKTFGEMQVKSEAKRSNRQKYLLKKFQTLIKERKESRNDRIGFDWKKENGLVLPHY